MPADKKHVLGAIYKTSIIENSEPLNVVITEDPQITVPENGTYTLNFMRKGRSLASWHVDYNGMVIDCRFDQLTNASALDAFPIINVLPPDILVEVAKARHAAEMDKKANP